MPARPASWVVSDQLTTIWAGAEWMVCGALQDKGYRRKDESPLRVLTTRRESLSLYREILRLTGLFVWRDDQGRLW